MLEVKRIKEADTNVKSYLNDGLLKKKQVDSNVLGILLKKGKRKLKSCSRDT